MHLFFLRYFAQIWTRFHIFLSLEKNNILSHLKIYLRPCFWNHFYSFKSFTKPFLIFENEQFLNLVKFCDVNDWKLYKVYIWDSPIVRLAVVVTATKSLRLRLWSRSNPKPQRIFNFFKIYAKDVQTLEIALEMWLWSPEVLFKDKTL